MQANSTNKHFHKIADDRVHGVASFPTLINLAYLVFHTDFIQMAEVQVILNSFEAFFVQHVKFT